MPQFFLLWHNRLQSSQQKQSQPTSSMLGRLFRYTKDRQRMPTEIGAITYSKGKAFYAKIRLNRHLRYSKTYQSGVSNEFLYSNLAEAYTELQDFQSSQRQMRMAIQLNSSYWLFHYRYGSLLKVHKLYDKSVEEFKKAIQLNTNNQAINNLIRAQIGEAFYHLGDNSKALSFIQESMKQSGPIENAFGFEKKIQILLKTFEYDQAEQLIHYCLKIAKGYFVWHWKLAQLEAVRQNYQKAVDAYIEALKLIKVEKRKSCKIKKGNKQKSPSYFDKQIYTLYRNISENYINLGKYKQAKPFVQEAIQLAPQDPCAYGLICRIQFLKGNKQKSLLFLSKMQERYKGNPYDCQQLAYYCFDLMQFDKSCKYAKLALQSIPDNDKLVEILGTSFCRKNEIVYAETFYKQTIQNKECEHVGQLGLGKIELFYNKNIQKAAEHMEKAQSLMISKMGSSQSNGFNKCFFRQFLCDVKIHIGYAYYLLRKYAGAVSYLQQSLKMGYNKYYSVHYLGMTYKQLRRPQQQLGIYQQFMNQCPTSQDIYYQIGEFYYSQGQHEESLNFFTKLKRPIYTYFYQINQKIGLCFYHQQKLDKSAQYFMKSIQQYNDYTQSYIGLSLLYNSQDINTQLKDKIYEFVLKQQNINHQEGRIKQMIPFNIHVFLKLIGKPRQSSAYFWTSICRIQEQYRSNHTLSSNSQRILIGFKGQYSILQPSIYSKYFLFQFFLVTKLIAFDKDVQILFQMFSRVNLSENQMTSNDTFLKGVNLLVEHYGAELKITAISHLLQYALEFNYSQGLSLYCYLSKQQQFNTIVPKYFQAYLLKQIKQFKQTCKFLQAFWTNKEERSYCQQDGNQIVKNTSQILKLYHKISQMNVDQSLSAHHVISNISVPWSLYQKEMQKRYGYFATIKLEDKIHRQQIKYVTETVKQTSLSKYSFKIKEMLKKMMSQRYLKRELIKLLSLNIYFPVLNHNQQMEAPLFCEMKSFFQKPEYSFSDFASKIEKIVNRQNLQGAEQEQVGFQLFSQFYKLEAQSEDNITKGQSEQGSNMCNLAPNSGQDQNEHQQRGQTDSLAERHEGQYFFKNKLVQQLKTVSQLVYFEDSGQQKTVPQNLNQKRELICYLLFKNTHAMMQYLSSAAVNKRHIPKYWNIEGWSQDIVNKKSLKYEMEKSSIPHQIKGYSQKLSELIQKLQRQADKILERPLKPQDIKIIYLLWNSGESQIAKYLFHVATGILELQELNIFHMDLEFRNTIKVGKFYKIMDYDLAFKWCNISQDIHETTCYQNTRKILQMLINYCGYSQDAGERKELEYVIDAIFPGLEEGKKLQIRKICTAQGQRDMNAVRLILQQHAKAFHRKQLKRLISFLSIQRIFKGKTKILNDYLAKYMDYKFNHKQVHDRFKKCFKMAP